MLELDELAAVAGEYGVAEGQVRRDHLISHILLALSIMDMPVVFFGGTALSRTFLTDPEIGARLSEDIDLCTEDRAEVAAELDERLPRLLRREYPGTTWDPPLRSGRTVDPGSWPPLMGCESVSNCSTPSSIVPSPNGRQRSVRSIRGIGTSQGESISQCPR